MNSGKISILKAFGRLPGLIQRNSGTARSSTAPVMKKRATPCLLIAERRARGKQRAESRKESKIRLNRGIEKGGSQLRA